MAVTQSPRLGLTRWGAGTDPLRRAQLDADNAKLDAAAALYGQGLFNARPAAGVAGRFYFAEDTDLVYYDDGATWVTVGTPPPAGATFTEDRITLGNEDDDVLELRSVPVETHTRSVTNGYTNGKLTSVTEKAGATTVKTTTLAYTGDQLTTVTEVAGGVTVTTTLAYDGAGVLTGTTRTVV